MRLMDWNRLVVSTTVGLILGVTLISGPLVVPPDFTGHLQTSYCDGSGNASVTVNNVPAASFTLEKSGENDSAYAVVGPPVELRAGDVHGCPIVTFKLVIPQLGFRSTSLAYLSPDGESRVTMDVVGGRIDPERIRNESYSASIELRLTGNETRLLHQENTTVEVRS